MDRHFDLLNITRNNMVKLLDSVSEEQLFVIPSGFKNNMIWNAGHALNAQQRLIYALAGVPLKVPDFFSALFTKGTSPADWKEKPDVKEIKSLLIDTEASLREDYRKGIFKSYKEYPTSYGFELKSIEDAIIFNNVHEGLHLGTMMALKKLV